MGERWVGRGRDRRWGRGRGNTKRTCKYIFNLIMAVIRCFRIINKAHLVQLVYFGMAGQIGLLVILVLSVSFPPVREHGGRRAMALHALHISTEQVRAWL